jgi:hypothetical protein
MVDNITKQHIRLKSLSGPINNSILCRRWIRKINVGEYRRANKKIQRNKKNKQKYTAYYVFDTTMHKQTHKT